MTSSQAREAFLASTIKSLKLIGFSFLKIFASRRSKLITAGILLLILLFLGLFKACSGKGPMKTKKYLIARESDWSRLSLTGKERNLQAFTDDLITSAAVKANLLIQIVVVGADYLWSGLDNGTYDAVVSTLMPNVVNQENYIFSDPFF